MSSSRDSRSAAVRLFSFDYGSKFAYGINQVQKNLR